MAAKRSKAKGPALVGPALPFSGSKGKAVYLFPDTNVFMHCHSFESIDWLAFAQADEVVLVVVQKVVIAELDKHKREHKSSKLRDRARNVSSTIVRLMRSKTAVRPGVFLELFGRYPEPFEGMNPLHADDLFIAAALQFQIQRSASVTVVTDDNNVLLTAESQGLHVLQPLDTMRVSPELDDTEAEVRRLKVEIEKLKYSRPSLKLSFHNGAALLLASIEPHRAISLAHLEHQIAVERSALRKLGLVGSKELEEHLKELALFLRTKAEYDERAARTLELRLIVHNEGAAPATRVDVSFSLEASFEILTKRELEPKRPNFQHLISAHARFSNDTFGQFRFPQAKVSHDPDWIVGPHNEAKIDLTAPVKQSGSTPLPWVWVRWRSGELSRGFKISAKIRSGEPPTLEQCEINVKFS